MVNKLLIGAIRRLIIPNYDKYGIHEEFKRVEEE